MPPSLRNLLVLVVSVSPAYLVWRVLDYAWSFAVISDRVGRVYFGWLSSISLLQWFYSTLLFFVFGAVLSRYFRGARAPAWVCGVGVACALMHLGLVSSWFAPQAAASTYFWHYGELAVLPLAAFFGATAALRRWPPAPRLNSSLKSRRSSSAA